MAQKKDEKIAAKLTVSNDEFSQKLSDRIEKGEELFNRSISNNDEFTGLKTDFNIWNEYNFEYLKLIFDILENDYMISYNQAGFSFLGTQMGVVQSDALQTFKNLIQYKLNDLKSLLSKSDLFRSNIPNKPLHSQNKSSNSFLKKEVFIVHGHDELAKTKTARFIEKLGLKPIILHEQASPSKTIIEKIEEYSNVGFGIILYTPCDLGGKQDNNPILKSRARQNVVFEHGFLIGKIGRSNVCALVKGDIETPNDISGVVYVTMDEADAWRYTIAKELKQAGYHVDMNEI